MSSNSLQSGLYVAVAAFVAIWVIMFIHHEMTLSHIPSGSTKTSPQSIANGGSLKIQNDRRGVTQKDKGSNMRSAKKQLTSKNSTGGPNIRFMHSKEKPRENIQKHEAQGPMPESDDATKDLIDVKANVTQSETEKIDSVHFEKLSMTDDGFRNIYRKPSTYRHGGHRGQLICHGERVDSEIIYWKVVPGDEAYESPITPHHGEHHDRYLTFEYDQGGWNNVRMSLESLVVVAHATGRTLVAPPQQHLYLLDKQHQDAEDTKAHDEMGFEDFFDMELLKSHKGFHIMEMEDFLSKEAVTGGLHGVLPPQNSTKIWGQALWSYLGKVADAKPEWMGHYIAFPAQGGDFNLQLSTVNESIAARMKAFGADRSPVLYDEALQNVHHIHFPARSPHRVLQHPYAFAFFADPKMQSFYKRFIRDYMRYKDNIQCAGAELVGAVRADALRVAPEFHGEYFALHIRRGDFQYKDVKLSAQQIVDNLHFPNGTSIIPKGALVYISTDDPDGVCKNCYVNRKPCTEYPSPKPEGCQEDTSWNAFIRAGWKIRFLRDYMNAGYLSHVNPNVHGIVESIVCSRAKVFVGTYFSTFTGYIHRLRGYHGIGESTYYHSTKYVFALQKEKSIGHGFSREWRAGWTDDGGGLI